MSVFICYSHEDKDFVDSLARVLVRNKTRVWLDRWELNVGDSLVQRVEDAITEADALLVVLSNASIKSEWVKRELSAATMRELQEKRVLVLPVLIDDCEIPLLLRDKVYADFRVDFGEGIIKILEAVAKITSETLGRTTDKEYFNDFSIFQAIIDDFYFIDIFIISLPSDANPGSILTMANIIANESATKKILELADIGLANHAKNLVFGTFLMSNILTNAEYSIELDDSEPVRKMFSIADPNGTEEYTLKFEVRRLGEDTGKNILFHTGDVLRQSFEQSLMRAKQLSDEENEEVIRIFGLNK